MDSLALWPTPLHLQVISPTFASTSAEWAHAGPCLVRETQLQPWEWLDEHRRSLRGFWPSSSNNWQPAVFGSQHSETSARHRLSCRFILQRKETSARQRFRCKCWRVCVKEEERSRLKVCEPHRTGKISILTWNGKLNVPFEEKMQLWKDCLISWEQKCSKVALHETRELESHRFQLHQANQWADQAQRENFMWRTRNEE